MRSMQEGQVLWRCTPKAGTRIRYFVGWFNVSSRIGRTTKRIVKRHNYVLVSAAFCLSVRFLHQLSFNVTVFTYTLLSGITDQCDAALAANFCRLNWKKDTVCTVFDLLRLTMENPPRFSACPSWQLNTFPGYMVSKKSIIICKVMRI